MRLKKVIWCLLTDGHRWAESHKRPGYYTCVKCRSRRSRDAIAGNPKTVYSR